MRELKTRAEFPALLVELGLTGIGVEVGVQYGQHAAQILGNWPGVLIAIDPWREQVDYSDIANVSQEEQDVIYRMAIGVLSPWVFKERRCIVIRDFGLAQSARFSRGFDFVYLDAMHDYRNVMDDLVAWTPLVKPGGILAGHDYLDGEMAFEGFGRPTTFGVKRAVDEFAAAMGYAVHVTTDDKFPTWMIRIP